MSKIHWSVSVSAHVLCISVLLLGVGCASMEMMEKPMATAEADSDMNANVTTNADGSRKIICENLQGCVWEVTCPDTGTFTMQAAAGGDIEISSRCEFNAQ